jgi:hypothetical protein
MSKRKQTRNPENVGTGLPRLPYAVPVLDRKKLRHTPAGPLRYFIGGTGVRRQGEYFVEALDSNFGLVFMGRDEVLIPGVDDPRLTQIPARAVPDKVRAELDRIASEAKEAL